MFPCSRPLSPSLTLGRIPDARTWHPPYTRAPIRRIRRFPSRPETWLRTGLSSGGSGDEPASAPQTTTSRRLIPRSRGGRVVRGLAPYTQGVRRPQQQRPRWRRMGHPSEESESQVHRLKLRFRPRPENLRRIRRALEEMGLPDQVMQEGTLLTSELVTNSIRHAGLGPDDYIDVAASWSGTVLRVIVRDSGSGALPLGIEAGSIRPSPGGQSGWGLTSSTGSPLGGERTSRAQLGSGSNSSTRDPRVRASSPAGSTLRRPQQRCPPPSPPR